MLKITKITKRPMSPTQENPRIYVWIKDENVLENLQKRHSRPYNEYRKLFPDIVRRIGLKADIKANWSQKAGCSCGCSPAFIVRNPGELRLNKDLHVLVDYVDEKK